MSRGLLFSVARNSKKTNEERRTKQRKRKENEENEEGLFCLTAFYTNISDSHTGPPSLPSQGSLFSGLTHPPFPPPKPVAYEGRFVTWLGSTGRLPFSTRIGTLLTLRSKYQNIFRRITPLFSISPGVVRLGSGFILVV